jgi:hypothetical protein
VVGWGFLAFFSPPMCSFWLSGVLGAEVVGARDDSWRGHFTVWLYLAAKPSHMGVDVDGLACPMHWHMVRSCQTRGQCLLPGVVLSCCCSGRWRLSGDVKLPGHRYLMES